MQIFKWLATGLSAGFHWHLSRRGRCSALANVQPDRLHETVSEVMLTSVGGPIYQRRMLMLQ